MTNPWTEHRANLDREEQQSEQKIKFPPILDADTIDPASIVLPAPIVGGIFSLTEKLELAGGSKSFKTWSLIDLGLSVANGTTWWNQPTFTRHVVYLNMELSKPFFEQRLVEVASARGLPLPTLFHVVHLRGAKLHDRQRWEAFLQYLESLLHRFPDPLLISDPIYKMLGGKSENSAGDINAMMDQLEDLIQRTQGANAFGHHFTKGNQADKQAIDRASGSGVFQRDPDTLLTMTKHDNEATHCYSVNLVLRNHPPIKDFVLEWRYPVFIPRNDLDPNDLHNPRTRGSKYTVQQLVDVLGNRSMRTKAYEKRAREEIGMVASTFHLFLKKAEKAGLIHKCETDEEWEVVKPTT